MNDKDENLNENEKERKRRETEKFVREYFSLRDQMKKLEEDLDLYYARRARFTNKFLKEVKTLTLDFYPEKYQSYFPGVNEELRQYGLLLFEEVDNLCWHYKESKPGYFSGLYDVKFKITTGYDMFKDRTDIPKHKEILECCQEDFEKEYVEGFYFECYKKHIHLLLKRLFQEFEPEIFSLPSQGFIELDGFLFIAMLEVWEIIREYIPADEIK